MADLASRITKPTDGAADAPKGETTPAEAPKDATPVADAQVDGASAAIGGSSLAEADGDVEVTISGDNDTPIYSAATWDDLGLYVNSCRRVSLPWRASNST